MSCRITLVSHKVALETNKLCFFLITLSLIVLVNGGMCSALAQAPIETAGNRADFSNIGARTPAFQRSQMWTISEFSLGKFLQNGKSVGKNKRSSITIPDETPHWLVGSYYSVRDGLAATLMLNNKGIAPITVQPTLYSKTGQQLDLPPVVVGASDFRYINLNDWINIGGENFREGNIRLFHTGKELVLGAQIYLIDEQNSLSFEEKLVELGKFDSRRLEGIWSNPSRDSKVTVILTNTSSSSLTVDAHLTRKPQSSNTPQTFILEPHETRILDVEKDFFEGDKAIESEAAALSLEHTGAKWSLIARAFISETATGYSNLVQFYNPTGGLMNEYQGAGIQMRSPGGERLKPVVVLRNTGSEKATITALCRLMKLSNPEDLTAAGSNSTDNLLRLEQMVRTAIFQT